MRKKIFNTVNVGGKIYSHNLERKVSKKGVNYIGGTIDVQTDDEGLNIVTVYYTYVAPTYPAKGDKAERPNPNYAILNKIIDSGKTVVSDGADVATIVELSPSLAVNDFVSRDGEIVAAKRLEGGFVSIKASMNDVKERNKFTADVLIAGVTTKEVEDGDDYITMKSYIFNWNGSISPVDLVVKSAGGIKYFESLEISKSNPVFIKVWGPIQSETVVTRVEEESAFGEPSIKEYTKTSRNWIVTGCSKEGPYEFGDEENGITADEIKKLLADREIHLAEVKKQNDEYLASKGTVSAPASAPVAAGGFNF